MRHIDRDQGRRILVTLAGVGIALIVMLLAGLLQKLTAKPAPTYHQRQPRDGETQTSSRQSGCSAMTQSKSGWALNQPARALPTWA